MKTFFKLPASSIFRAPGFCAALLFLSIVPTHGQIVAGFTGGNDTTNGGAAAPAPDTYKGTGGNGWIGGWSTAGALNGTVINTAPLNTGGNYLQMTETPSNVADVFVNRAYNGVSATAAQTINLDIRLDSTTATLGTVFDYLTVADGSAAGVGNTSDFIIRAYGATNGGAQSLKWALYNGDRLGSALNTGRFVDSGISLVTGTTYHFTIDLQPATQDWSATISDGVSSFTSGTLGFRQGTTTIANRLIFNSKDADVSDGVVYSLDNIVIVPEPASYSLLFGSLGMAFGLQRFRRRQA